MCSEGAIDGAVRNWDGAVGKWDGTVRWKQYGPLER